MPLSPGQMLSYFRIVEKIGEGGMGVVWKAVDTRLDRAVAIKALPAEFVEEPERLARFEREAKVLASLNHLHIAAIHGLEKVEGEQFLVLELVEGETLAELLGRGPLRVREALDTARQIAEALGAAHDVGVIHRDLKPGNIKVTPEGTVKVLDFGLAKTSTKKGASSPDPAQSPTVTHEATKAGVILGTTAYMSPEQARGMPVDERADIWAFGCVLFEVLTAQRAFPGDTAGDTVAAILEHEPDWSRLPEATPRPIRVLLQRCLRKELKRRLHHVSDARIEIEDALSEASQAPSQQAATLHRKSWRPLVAWSLVMLALVVTAVTVWILRSPARLQSPPVTRFAFTLPRGQHLERGFGSSVVLSPDGTRLVYVGHSSDLSLRPQLYLRALDSFTANVIPGTEDASAPFFSPDGQRVGFFSKGKLWKVPVAGGARVAICDVAGVGTGASWGVDDTIIFTVFGSGLLRVSGSGGQPEALTTPDSERGELGHQWPQILPGDRGVLFAIVTSEAGRIVLWSPKTDEQRVLLEGSAAARYLPTGHLVYARPGGLWAVPFDLAKLKTDGSPTQILHDVTRQFTVSEAGSIVYAINPAAERTLVWVDRKGHVTPITEVPARYGNLRLSPDGRRIAVSIRMEDAGSDIWIYDLARGTRTRLTVDGSSSNPLWTPDGSRIAFASTRSGPINIYWKPVDESGEAESLLTREYPQSPLSWSPDGQKLVFREYHPKSTGDIWVWSIEGDRPTSPVMATSFDEWWAELSPNGDWLAYVSNESGRDEVYVQPFPDPGGRWQVSSDGGWFPVWSTDGRELFYWEQSGQMMVVAVETEPVFTAGRPQRLFEGPFAGAFDLAPDGQRFVMTRSVEDSEAFQTELRIVLNWFQELEYRVPLREGR